MAEHIEREAVIELLEEKQRAICPVGRCGRGYVYGRDRDEYDMIEADIDAVQKIPAADVVSREAFDQVVWERDVALSQLAEIGKGLGEKMDDVQRVAEWKGLHNK